MVKKVLLYAAVIWVSLIAFMPKESLYFAFENMLKERHVHINEKHTKEKPWGLNIDNGNIYIFGIPTTLFDRATVTSLLTYNTLTIYHADIKNELVETPIAIDRLEAVYKIWDPLRLSLEMNGTLGRAVGRVDLRKRTLRVDFTDEQKLDAVKRFLHKDKKGWYYATSF